METLIFLNYPLEDLEAISQLVRNNDSFVTLLTGDVYDLKNYLIETNPKKISAILDRNFNTRITGLVKQVRIPEKAVKDYQWAAAVMSFCQVAEIIFQYGSSLQEYAFKNGGEAALPEIEHFYRADNTDPKAFINYAIGKANYLDISSSNYLNPYSHKITPARWEKQIYEFRLNYILVLKIVLLEREVGISYHAMIKFIDWMEHDFIFGVPAFHFANLLFSPSRIKRMLKNKTISDVKNIAWDLALIQHWKRDALNGLKINEPVFLITRDKVVKYISKRLTAEDMKEFKKHTVEQWINNKKGGETVFNRYMDLHLSLTEASDARKKPTDQELDELTSELENKLCCNK